MTFINMKARDLHFVSFWT